MGEKWVQWEYQAMCRRMEGRFEWFRPSDASFLGLRFPGADGPPIPAAVYFVAFRIRMMEKLRVEAATLSWTSQSRSTTRSSAPRAWMAARS
jgi:hypothetical protein